MSVKRGFKLKLNLSYIFVISVSLGIIAFFLDQNLEENSLQNIKSTLINQANLIESQIAIESFKAEDLDYLDSLVKTLSPRANCRISLINKEGKVLADSEKSREELMRMENHLDRPEVRQALEGLSAIDTRYSSTLKINMLYAALPLKDKNEVMGVLRLALPLVSVRKTLSVIKGIVLMGLLFSLGLSLILGSIVAGRVIKPINGMIQASRRFAAGDFSRRISRYPHDEIGELAETLNMMAGDLENKIREIEKQNQHLAAVFNSMIEGVIVTDKSGKIIAVNPTIERIFSVKSQDCKGKLLLEAIRNNEIFEVVNDVLNRGEPVSRDLNLILPVQKIFQVNASAIFEKDKVSGSLVVIHDITGIRRLETMRRDFVANVSHELKTPLTSIKGFVETLLEGALDDKENSRNFLKIIQEHANRLDNLINDLLALSYLESQKAELKKEELNLQELADKVSAGFRAQLKKKQIELKDNLPSQLTVKADKNKLEQVLTNLIDNAIKFNKEKGWINIDFQDTYYSLKVLVEDSGMGIPAKDIPRIFERFYRVDKARSRELAGTGLGLSIVKHIVELHGGSVGVESTEGLGSKFYFTLPR